MSKQQKDVVDTFKQEAPYISEARKKAKEYLGDRYILHPQSTYKGNWLKHA
jgi:hypothetical protein